MVSGHCIWDFEGTWAFLLEIAGLFWLCIRSRVTLMRTYCVVADYVGGVIAFYALGYSEVYELQLFVDLYIYIYIYMCVCVCVWINKCINVHTHTHMHAYTSVCVCVRVCVWPWGSWRAWGRRVPRAFHAPPAQQHITTHYQHIGNTVYNSFWCTTCTASIIAFQTPRSERTCFLYIYI